MATTAEILKSASKPTFTFDVSRDGSSSVILDNTRERDDALRKLLAQRKGIARGLKDLSGRGALTPDLLREARDRAMATGSTEEGFNTFLGREGINIPKGYQSASEGQEMGNPEDASMQAAQNVMYQREFGTGLGTLKAMQDPNYELGSGSALRQPPRQIGTKAGALRRASRRLRKQGYAAQAGQMAMASEMQRLTEPSIVRPADRKMQMDQRIEAGNIRRQAIEQERQNMQEAGRMTGQQLGAPQIGAQRNNGTDKKRRLTGQYIR